MGLHAFVHEHLPAAPARVLEVGCGRGDLARALARAGHRVVAIDPQAPDGDLFRTTTLEEFADPEPFDAVVASLALHHVADLPRAFDKVVALLRPRGRLIVNEHAVDRLDEPTARWYLDKRTQARPDTSQSLERCLREWSDDHADLHGYAAMRRELDSRFTERFFTWMPYLYGELGGVASEAEEQALIDAGAIQATGFRYVGERPATETTQDPIGRGRVAADFQILAQLLVADRAAFGKERLDLLEHERVALDGGRVMRSSGQMPSASVGEGNPPGRPRRAAAILFGCGI